MSVNNVQTSQVSTRSKSNQQINKLRVPDDKIMSTISIHTSRATTRSQSSLQKNKSRIPDEKIESFQNTTIPSGPSLLSNVKSKNKWTEELKGCTEVLKELLAEKNLERASLFYKPSMDLYDKNIIKKPIDLSIIKRKLDNMEYKNGKEFKTDVNLMFSNFYSFEFKDHSMISLARELQAIFETKMSNVISNSSMQVEEENESNSQDQPDFDLKDLDHKRKFQEIEEELAFLKAEMNKLIDKIAKKKKKKIA